MRFPLNIFCHQSLRKKIQDLPSPLQSALDRCWRKLRQGQWDVGLRAKLLKGFPQRIWEARLDDGNRFIFSWARVSLDGNTEETVIQAWDVVEHDGVDYVRRRRFSGEFSIVEFLEEGEGPLEFRRVGPEDLSKGSEIDLEASSPLLPFDGSQWEPLTPDQWEALILSGSAEIEEKLTDEQLTTVKRWGHLTLEGTAGTGKTTVAVFRLYREIEIHSAGGELPILYVTYSERLRKTAADLFAAIAHKNGAFASAPAVEIEKTLGVAQFLSMRQLLVGLLQEHGKQIDWTQIVSYSRFCHDTKHLHRLPVPAASAWTEIRCLIKGAQRLSSHDFLPLDVYMRKGRARSTELSDKEREAIYGFAQKYQTELQASGRLDEIDLVHEAIILNPPGSHRYRLIVCDEVQDLTEAHLQLLFNLLSPGGFLVCTGDLNQIVNPSLFEWKDISNAYYRSGRDQPFHERLRVNFRNVGSIAHLGRQILKLKHNLKLRNASAVQEESHMIWGDDPSLVTDLEDLETLDNGLRSLNAKQAIIVTTEAERQTIAERAGHQFVYTIEEAKGLEFDAVILWRPFTSTVKTWNRALRGTIDKHVKRQLTHDLNLLYVAVTRARRRLIIVDPDNFLWKREEFAGAVVVQSPASIQQLARALSTEELLERGQYFLEQGHFARAEYCFAQANDEPLRHQALGCRLEGEGDWLAAAEVFLSLADATRAARLFEEGGAFDRAIELFDLINDTGSSQRCRALQAEATGDFELAAVAWLALENLERAGRAIDRSSDRSKGGKLRMQWLTQKGDKPALAQHYELSGQPQEAAPIWEALGERDRACACFEKAGLWSEVKRLSPAKDLAAPAKQPLKTANVRHAPSSPMPDNRQPKGSKREPLPQVRTSRPDHRSLISFHRTNTSFKNKEWDAKELQAMDLSDLSTTLGFLAEQQTAAGPEAPQAFDYLERAQALERVGRFDDAEKLYIKSLSFKCRHPYQPQGYTKLLLKQHRYSEALLWAERLFEMHLEDHPRDGGSDERCLLAQCHLGLGSLEAAYQCFKGSDVFLRSHFPTYDELKARLEADGKLEMAEEIDKVLGLWR